MLQNSHVTKHGCRPVGEGGCPYCGDVVATCTVDDVAGCSRIKELRRAISGALDCYEDGSLEMPKEFVDCFEDKAGYLAADEVARKSRAIANRKNYLMQEAFLEEARAAGASSVGVGDGG